MDARTIFTHQAKAARTQAGGRGSKYAAGGATSRFDVFHLANGVN